MKSLVTSLLALGVLGGAFLATEGCSSSKPSSGFIPDSADSGNASADNSDGGSNTNFGSSDASVDVQMDPLKGCATNTTPVTKLPVYLLFLADRSGSMSGTKWSAVQSAMVSLFQSMAMEMDTNQGVGLILFPADGSESGPYPGAKDVFVNYVDDPQLQALYARLGVDSKGMNGKDMTLGSTPTWEAMGGPLKNGQQTGAYGELENLVVAAPLPANGKKVLVLMTDGEPNDTGQDYDGLAAKELALGSDKGPIQTYAIAIGDLGSSGDVDPTFLAGIAVAGGTAPPGCDPQEMTNVAKMCHYQVQPGQKTPAALAQDFINAFNHIRASASACELSLSTDAANADPTKVNVVEDDGNGNLTLVKQDAQNGWTFDNPMMPTKVILHGQACTDAVNNIKGQVEVILGCKTQTN